MNSANIDLETLQFIIRLKAVNKAWYEMVLVSARVSSKLAHETIKQCVRYVNYAPLHADLNTTFQICRAVNSGWLTDESLKSVGTAGYEIQVQKVIKKVKQNATFRDFK